MKLLAIPWCLSMLFPVLSMADDLKSPSNMKAPPLTFCGVVQSLEPMPNTRGHSYLLADVNPKFLLLVKTVDVLHLGLPNRYDEDRTQAFGIHSPARLFSADTEDVIGRKFGFIYSEAKKHGESGKLEISECADHGGATNDGNGAKAAK